MKRLLSIALSVATCGGTAATQPPVATPTTHTLTGSLALADSNAECDRNWAR
jgi:hypothetical protein